MTVRWMNQNRCHKVMEKHRGSSVNFRNNRIMLPTFSNHKDAICLIWKADGKLIVYYLLQEVNFSSNYSLKSWESLFWACHKLFSQHLCFVAITRNVNTFCNFSMHISCHAFKVKLCVVNFTLKQDSYQNAKRKFTASLMKGIQQTFASITAKICISIDIITSCNQHVSILLYQTTP